MNRDLDSLARGPLAIAAALAVAVLIQWALVSQGLTQFIVPPPEQVGQQFFTSLKGHNFQAARDKLSEALRQQVTADDLRQLTERLEQATRGIEQASGEEAQAQGTAATVQVTVNLNNGSERTVEVPLIQEHGLWHITSLAPLETLLSP